MDPLSDVLALLRPKAYITGGIAAGDAWSVLFPAQPRIKCYSIVSGECWLALDGEADPVRLVAGSCVLLPHGRAFRMASDLSLPARDIRDLLAARTANEDILVASPGDQFLVIGCHFELDGDGRFLLDLLRPIVRLESETQKQSLRWAVERMLAEMRNPQPGGTLIARQIAYTLLVEALRLHLADLTARGTGWLFALADERMRKALSLMHARPAHGWSLQELARAVGMSRTAFALSFKQRVGATPMDYLTRWRMTLASRKLHETQDTISSVGLSLGYRSESAFSAAFKRQWGQSPRQHLRESRSRTA